MKKCFFVSDLHGRISRYEKLFEQIEKELPLALFLGGDLLPHGLKPDAKYPDFTLDYLFPAFYNLKGKLGKNYPAIFLILGNDDARSEEDKFIAESEKGLFQYANQQKFHFENHMVYGYSCVPPTPFQMKDWEKYDVSRYVDPGCIHPTEGFRTKQADEDIEYASIKKDLELLTHDDDLTNAIILFHSPPYKTNLDRAALDGKMIDHVPLDVHVGSIAIKRFIQQKQPKITLHGHIHESTRITGQWKQTFGGTIAFNAAHDGSELSLITFTLESPEDARRRLI